MSHLSELKDPQSVTHEHAMDLLNAKRYDYADGHTCYGGGCNCCCWGCQQDRAFEEDWGWDIYEETLA